MNDHQKQEGKLLSAIEKFVCDPEGFVYFAYPWGEGQLEGCSGPDVWQVEILREIGEASKTGTMTINGAIVHGIRSAVASGHGIGKTALLVWLVHWFMSTREDPQIVVTANTTIQLETKTWRELAKWHKMSVHAHWFIWTATKFYAVCNPKSWYAKCIPWNKDRAEAFAGTHEKNVLIIFDEASLIDDEIWTVAEGAMTTEGAMWIAFGNPTRNTGRFRECFGRFKHRWKTKQIDSRTAKMADPNLLKQWVEDYGEDSDFVRVRVRGVFPRASSMQFIPSDLVEAARKRVLTKGDIKHAPVIIGVDVARFGDDQSVILVRQGLAVLEVKKYREVDPITLGNLVAVAEDDWKADAIFVDEIGIGSGTLDYLRRIGRHPLGVISGAKAKNTRGYFNLRAEMWDGIKEWLRHGGSLPEDDQEFAEDLIGPEYGFDIHNRVQLEKKEDMKKRGLASPDVADALAFTFAAPVAKTKKDWYEPEVPGGGKCITEYDPLHFGMEVA